MERERYKYKSDPRRPHVGVLPPYTPRLFLFLDDSLCKRISHISLNKENNSLFLSALGLSFPALVCDLLLSSFTFWASIISLFNFVVLCILAGTNLLSATERTSFDVDHFSTSFCRYSIDWRSFVDIGPIFLDAFDFHILLISSFLKVIYAMAEHTGRYHLQRQWGQSPLSECKQRQRHWYQLDPTIDFD